MIIRRKVKIRYIKLAKAMILTKGFGFFGAMK
jgi:hypothetical protein